MCRSVPSCELRRHEAPRQLHRSTTLRDSASSRRRSIRTSTNGRRREIFPAHEVFKKLGDARPARHQQADEYGGLGLDYSYSMAMAEALGHIDGGGVPMAIGVQTDMATPALARFGTRRAAPGIPRAGDRRRHGRLHRRLRDRRRLRRRRDQDRRARKDGGDYVINGAKMWITNSPQADWMCLLANTGEGRPHKNKSLIIVPMKTKGVTIAQEDRQARHALVRHRR